MNPLYKAYGCREEDWSPHDDDYGSWRDHLQKIDLVEEMWTRGLEYSSLLECLNHKDVNQAYKIFTEVVMEHLRHAFEDLHGGDIDEYVRRSSIHGDLHDMGKPMPDEKE